MPITLRSLSTLAAAAALGLTPALAAHAQAATTTTVTTTAGAGTAPVSVTTTATTAAPGPVVAGPACTQPPMPTGPMRSKADADALNASLDSYQKCTAAYSAEHQAIAEANAKAANGAVRAFNAYVGELNAAVKAQAASAAK